MQIEDRDKPMLSNRERQVLELIAKGYSAKEVAKACELSPRTIEHHIENIRNKLRARNRAHIISKAVMHGELSKLTYPQGLPTA